jgi:ABC-2 type transport system ATP-binding protein
MDDNLNDRLRETHQHTAPALVVQGAAHTYGERRVLTGIDLTLFPGEIYALLGRNGAGKSTLLRAISGRHDINGGAIYVGENKHPREAAASGMLGYVPQDIALYPHLTVRENLDFFGRMAGLPGSNCKQAISDILNSAALEERRDQLVGSLSGGYQRRVNIAAAAMTHPHLLVLDEPTVGIDIQAREAIHTLLRKLRDAGVAIILTTHDLEQAQVLADRIAILEGGALVLEGHPLTLLHSMFGDSKEMLVELHEMPDDHAAYQLHSLHLTPSQSPFMWKRILDGGGADVSEMTDWLVAHGVNVKEIRIRRPDLSSLFVHVIGQDLTA